MDAMFSVNSVVNKLFHVKKACKSSSKYRAALYFFWADSFFESVLV